MNIGVSLTLVVQLEDARAGLRRRAVVDGQGVGGAADHLTLHQQRVIGQDQQGAALVGAPDGQLLAVREVHALHLQEQPAIKSGFVLVKNRRT